MRLAGLAGLPERCSVWHPCWQDGGAAIYSILRGLGLNSGSKRNKAIGFFNLRRSLGNSSHQIPVQALMVPDDFEGLLPVVGSHPADRPMQAEVVSDLSIGKQLRSCWAPASQRTIWLLISFLKARSTPSGVWILVNMSRRNAIGNQSPLEINRWGSFECRACRGIWQDRRKSLMVIRSPVPASRCHSQIQCHI